MALEFKNYDYQRIMTFGKKVLEIPSPSGYTNNVISFLLDECNKRHLNAYKAVNGNLIIEMKGKEDYIVGLAAHADTLGAMVRSIKADGTLRFSVIGGPILPTYDGEYCEVITRDGKKFTGTFLSNAPAVHVHKESRSLSRNEETMHVRIDEEVKSKDDVLKLGIYNGDFIAVDPKTTITESGFIKSRFLDDKISVAILFNVIDYLLENNITPKYTLKFIITVNEEEGFGASYIPKVDELLAVDMGCVGEDLDGNEYKVSICAKDTGCPYNFDMTNRLIDLAKCNKLDYAVDVFPYYSSDVITALKGGNNIRGALIGSGVAASHGMERTHLKGLINTMKLVLAYICE